jgi:hypothetical protein
VLATGTLSGALASARVGSASTRGAGAASARGACFTTAAAGRGSLAVGGGRAGDALLDRWRRVAARRALVSPSFLLARASDDGGANPLLDHVPGVFLVDCATDLLHLELLEDAHVIAHGDPQRRDPPHELLVLDPELSRHFVDSH